MWTKRFIIAAIVQGAIAIALTSFLVLSQISILKPEVSMVIASGSAGTWFLFGYIMYIVVGVIGVGVSSLFYHYLEEVMQRSYSGVIARIMAWSHLMLMNIGILVTCGLLMYGGYSAGASMLPISVGGKEFDEGQAHEILAPIVEPIGLAILIVCAGVLLGGIGFVVVYSRVEHVP